MPIEIERKFLLRSDAWRTQVSHRHHITDGLIAGSDGRKVRVRVRDDQATLAVKGRRDGIQRDEFEYPIPLADAREMLAAHCDGFVLQKTRHMVPCAAPDAPLFWEIDEYHGLLAGVLMAEIELPRQDCTFARPDWLGDEITGQEVWRKISLLRARQQADQGAAARSA